jgi:Ca-activated chloride channel family protein
MKVLAAVAIAALMLGLVLGGTAAVGRVLLAAGLPALAAQVFVTPEWRAVAQYRAGHYAQAAQEFAAVDTPFNLGNAQVRLGNHAAALEAYDLAIAQGHPDARANFDVVAAYYAGLGLDPAVLALFPRRTDGPTAEGFIALGNARAAGTGSDTTNATTMLGLAQLESRGPLAVRRIFDDRFIVADDRWLAQLDDVPGAFLAARITAEQKRRAGLGLTPSDPEDPR